MAQIYHGFNGIISLVQSVKAGGKKNICWWCLRDSPGTQEGLQDQAWDLCKYKSPKLWPGYQKQGSTRTGTQVANWFSGGES